MLQESARRLLSKEFSSERARAVEASAVGHSKEIWSQLASLGWNSLLVPQSAGGGGLGVLELALLAEEMGRAAASSPLLVSAGLATTCLKAIPDPSLVQELLTSLANSDTVISVALIDASSRDERSKPKLPLDNAGTGRYTLTGAKVLVPYAASANTFLVSAVTDVGETALVAIDTGREGISLQRNQTLGADPLFEVRFDGVVIDEHQILAKGAVAEAALDKGLEVATVIAMAEAVGYCEGLIDIAVEHTSLREQFGQPIGAFQAVSHPLADMRIQADACRLMAFEAAWLLDQGRSATLEIASAKVLANDAVENITVDGHRVHGAIGYSKEHDAQLYTRRARAFAVNWGDNEREIERAAVALGL